VPISHTVFAAGLGEARRLETAGGRHVTLVPAANRAAAAEIAAAQATAGAKPNILVIFGDDVGQTNISAYLGDRDEFLPTTRRSTRASGWVASRSIR
jgi:hypothetical protein